jgi:hypothetical protein
VASNKGLDRSVYGGWRFIGNAVPVPFIGVVCMFFTGSRWLVRGRISLDVLSLLVVLPAKRRDNFRYRAGDAAGVFTGSTHLRYPAAFTRGFGRLFTEHQRPNILSVEV